MKNSIVWLKVMLSPGCSLVVMSCAAVLLAACGGGGSSAPVSGPAPEVPPVAVIDPLAPEAPVDLAAAVASLSVGSEGVGGDAAGDAGVGGAAGDGAALRRATIVLTDSAGKTLTGQTDDAGNYLIRYKSAEYKTPFVMKVIDAGGNVLAAPSEATVPAGKVARININPLTDKITSDILPATVAGTDKQFSGASLNLASLPQAKTNLLASIRAALSTAGVTNTTAFDPVTSKYAYDGTGVDAVIESISLTRNPGSGATQLQAKLAGLVTAADGSVAPTLISASTPLATTQVAISSSPALTFGKLKAWVDYQNACLAVTRPASVDCSDATQNKAISTIYKQNSKDFSEDFRTLVSETGLKGVAGSEARNPNILYTTRSAGSAVDDIAVVELTIRQPRTGPLAGNISTPIEYTKILVFKRDDVTTGLIAGNWILQGNQRSFDWGVQPNYFTLVQQNPAKQPDVAGNVPSVTYAGLRLTFSAQVFNPATRTYNAPNVYAVRLKGPGLPAAGLVYARTTSNGSSNLTILNKTGVIPSETTTSARPQTDFRMSAASYPSGGAVNASVWVGRPDGANLPVYADNPTTTNFGSLQAFGLYSAEIYVNGSTTPILETTRVLAPIEAPANYVQRPLHDLSPSLSQITPPQVATTSIISQWNRNPLALRIESSYFLYQTADFRQFTSAANLSDAFSVGAQTSTSVSIPVSQGTAPGYTTGSEAREIGITGTAARARFSQSVIWNN